MFQSAIVFMIAIFLFSCCSSQLLSEEVDKVSTSMIKECVWPVFNEKIWMRLQKPFQQFPHIPIFFPCRQNMSFVSHKQSLIDKLRSPDCCWKASAAHMWAYIFACVFHSVSQQYWKIVSQSSLARPLPSYKEEMGNLNHGIDLSRIIENSRPHDHSSEQNAIIG